MFNLRPYQHDIINASRQAFRDGFRSPVIVAPTGSGKTQIFTSIASNIKKKNNRVLILVHREEILQQTLFKLFSFGIQSGQIISGRPMTRDSIQVAMVNTIINRLDYFSKDYFDLIIIDEGHHGVAQTW